MADNEEYELPPVPYLNKEFLQSPPARILRILAEYLEPADRLRRAHVHDTIVFFGSARSPSPEQAAEQLAKVNEQIAQAKTLTPELEQEGIVARTVIPDMPVRVEYALTRKGRALGTAVDAIADWAHKWTRPHTDQESTKRTRARPRSRTSS